MKPHEHFLVGGTAALLPDFVLAWFVLRKEWLPESHILVRIHRFLHSPQGWLAFAFIGLTTHYIMDWISPHRIGFHEYTRPAVLRWIR